MTSSEEVDDGKRQNVDYEGRSPVAAELRKMITKIDPSVTNPAPLGLFAFAITTALLQVEHAKLAGENTPEDLMGVSHLVWGFAIFYGGLLQVIAGLGEYRKNNILGYTAFLSYGGFWMSLGLAHIVLMLSPNESVTSAGINLQAIQAMLVMFGFLTGVFWICSFAVNMTICSLFFLLMSLFFLLAGGTVNDTCDTVAGYVGFLTAFNAFWLAAAEMVNDVLGKGKQIIPLGKFDKNPFKCLFAPSSRSEEGLSDVRSKGPREERRSTVATTGFRDSIKAWVRIGSVKVSHNDQNIDEESPQTST